MTFHFTRRTAAVVSAAALGLGGALTAAVPAAQAATALPTCTVGNLKVSLGAQDHGAGQLYWPIRFTNTSGHTCALRGYPGTSVLNGARHQIGAAAGRTGQSYGTVTLRPGRTAVSVIHTTNGPLGGACRATGSYVRVYPPASYTAVTLPARLQVCSGQFTVTPVALQ
ncbi:DUF4232 domain-containing protein [Streptomyces sp. NPDC092296]|uniref:DUF4232 domain-containing protein n=1 Tax=Streptomyces sp. NPDC092296 TaxID=3366012 RepID=UPI003823ECF2